MDELVLRQVTDDDVPVFYDHQRDAEATRLAGFPAREREGHDQHWARIRANPEVLTRTVALGGEVVGNLVSWVEDGRREVGYWIAREHWGRGIASEALAQFLIDPATSRPLYAHVAAHNRGSIRVLTKCGFEVCADEVDHDEVVMVLY